MKFTQLMLLNSLVLMLAFSCKKENTEPEIPVLTTAPLVFNDLKADRTGIRVGETTSVTATAEGDNLLYSWTCSSGTIVGQGSQVTYGSTCVSCKGLNTITCTVSNGSGSQTKSIEVSIN